MIVQRFIDVGSLNFIILMTAMIILPRNIFVMILVLGITRWDRWCQAYPGAPVIVIKPNTYAFGRATLSPSRWHALIRQDPPNIMPTIIIAFTLGVGLGHLSEAALDLLGFGLPMSFTSLG